jgi:hypothetical protein
MNQVSLVQKTQRIQKLLREDSDERSAQASELILLDQLVKVDTEKLEGETQMLTMNESVLQTEEVMVIVLVVLAVQLQVKETYEQEIQI